MERENGYEIDQKSKLNKKQIGNKAAHEASLPSCAPIRGEKP